MKRRVKIRRRIKVRRKIRSRIFGRLTIHTINVPCSIFTNRGKKRFQTFKWQDLKVCVANYHSRREELETLWPECIGCKKWIPFLPEAYWPEVFGPDEDSAPPKPSITKKKRRRIKQ